MKRVKLPPASMAPDYIANARQAVASARQILKEKARKIGQYYSSRKQVRMAGQTVWSGILEAMAGILNIRAGLTQGQSLNLATIRQFVGSYDPEIVRLLDGSYDTICILMGYDGTQSVAIAREALSMADELIDWCEKISAANRLDDNLKP